MGFKGHKHSVETKMKASKRSREMWAALSVEQREEIRRKQAEGHARASQEQRARKSIALSKGNKAYWDTVATDERKARGEKLQSGLQRWREENPESYAAVQAKRIESVRKYHDNVSPEVKQRRIERSIRGRVQKALERERQCPTVEWQPNDARKQALLARLREKQDGKA